MESGAFVKALIGPVGSGKSTCAVQDLLIRAHAQRPAPDGRRRTRFAVIRNTYPELQNTTVRTVEDWVPPDIGKWNRSAPIKWELKTNDFETEWIFLALDRAEDAKKLLSLELTAAWVNEAREIDRAIIDALTARVGRFPGMSDGGATMPGLVLDSNPGAEDSWLEMMAENPPEGWEFFRQPSGLSAEAENIANLPRNYYDRVASGKSQSYIDVYVHGKPGILSSGKAVFPEFNKAIHVTDDLLEPIPNLPVRIGIDFGLQPAAVFGQRLPDGRWHILGELVTPADQQQGAASFGEWVAAVIEDNFSDRQQFWAHGDPAGRQRAQSDEGRAMAAFSDAAKIQCRPAPTNSFTERREAVASALSRLIGGKPAVTISGRDCPALVRALAGGYRFARIQGSDGPRDLPTAAKNHHSHIADAFQYLIVSADSLAAKRAAQRASQPQQTRAIGAPEVATW